MSYELTSQDVLPNRRVGLKDSSYRGNYSTPRPLSIAIVWYCPRPPIMQIIMVGALWKGVTLAISVPSPYPSPNRSNDSSAETGGGFYMRVLLSAEDFCYHPIPGSPDSWIYTPSHRSIATKSPHHRTLRTNKVIL